MKKKPLKNMPWYANAVAICIGVLLFVVLTRWSAIAGGIQKFLGFFSPVFIGCVLAYLVNPLAKLYARGFAGKTSGKKREWLANLLAFVSVLLIIALAILVILPQLIDSGTNFAMNLNGYVGSLERLMERWGLFERLGLGVGLLDSSKTILDAVSNYALKNLSKILNASADVGKGLIQLVLGFILSIYLLSEKQSLKNGVKRLMKALTPAARYEGFVIFLRRCDSILSRYIVYNLLDSFIVGIVNAVFMLLTGMPYAGLVSVLVGITNLIPTFGPVIGGILGAFVLVLVNPWYALMFLVFTVLLQTVDGYVLKPRLFGSSLGVSGLWILIGVIVGGRMFGVIGILIAIPAVAILDAVYREYVMPGLEARRARKEERSDLPDREPEEKEAALGAPDGEE